MAKKAKKKITFDVKSSIGPCEISFLRLLKRTLDVSKRNINCGKKSTVHELNRNLDMCPLMKHKTFVGFNSKPRFCNGSNICSMIKMIIEANTNAKKHASEKMHKLSHFFVCLLPASSR